jgi:hypothetical protein
MTKLWPSPSSTLVSILRDDRAGNGEAIERQRIAVIERGNFRLDVQANVVVPGDVRREGQPDANSRN